MYILPDNTVSVFVHCFFSISVQPFSKSTAMSIQHVLVSTASVCDTLHCDICVSTVPLAVPAETGVVLHVKCHYFSFDFIKTVVSILFNMTSKFEVLRQPFQRFELLQG
jgi:hypothetical protein